MRRALRDPGAAGALRDPGAGPGPATGGPLGLGAGVQRDQADSDSVSARWGSRVSEVVLVRVEPRRKMRPELEGLRRGPGWITGTALAAAGRGCHGAITVESLNGLGW